MSVVVVAERYISMVIFANILSVLIIAKILMLKTRMNNGRYKYQYIMEQVKRPILPLIQIFKERSTVFT